MNVFYGYVDKIIGYQSQPPGASGNRLLRELEVPLFACNCVGGFLFFFLIEFFI